MKQREIICMNEVDVITATILLFVFLIIITILLKKSQKKREEERLIWEESERLSEEYEEKVKSHNHIIGNPISSYGEKINKTNQSSEKVSNKMSNCLDTHNSEVVTTLADNAVDSDEIAKYLKCLGSNSNNNQSTDFIIIEGVLTKYCGKSTEVVIPETVVKIDNNAFTDCDYIKTISIPNCVAEIGNNAFSSLRNLTRLYLPKGRFNNLSLKISTKLKVYTRIPDNTIDCYILGLKNAISLTGNLPSELDRLFEMEDEFEMLFDYYFVKRLKQMRMDKIILELINNSMYIKKLLSFVQFEIAYIYIKSSNVRAVDYLEASSENGNIHATFTLALLYGVGKIVEKNDKKSFMLTKHCAEQGFTEAMILLAEQYQKGIGTNIDLQQAKLWLLKAGHNGNKEAMEMLINLYLFQ
jgi:hypothetical protein